MNTERLTTGGGQARNPTPRGAASLPAAFGEHPTAGGFLFEGYVALRLRDAIVDDT